jgi:hypothetical protein
LRQQRLNKRPLPHGQGSLRPSFSKSSLSPWTILRPRLTWASLRIASTALGHHLESRARRRRNRNWTAWHTSLVLGRFVDESGVDRLSSPGAQTTRRPTRFATIEGRTLGHEVALLARRRCS